MDNNRQVRTPDGSQYKIPNGSWTAVVGGVHWAVPPALASDVLVGPFVSEREAGVEAARLRSCGGSGGCSM